MDDRVAQGMGAFQPLRLRLQPGDQIIDLTAAGVLIGRQSDVDLRVPHPDVSRHHCRLQFSEGSWQIVDLDSLNGVFLNGARIRRSAAVSPGDQIRICGIALDVEVAQPVADGPSQMLRSIASALPQPTEPRRVA